MLITSKCAQSPQDRPWDAAVLKIGYLRSYNSPEVHQALEEFSAKYPGISFSFCMATMKNYLLYCAPAVRSGAQRSAESLFDEYVNLILTTSCMYIELAARNPVAALPSVTVQELKNIPCILVASKEQQAIEKEFYQTIIGIQGEILYAENLEEARMMVISGQGFLPVEGSSQAMTFGASIRRVPLCRGEEQITRNYCLFWKKDNSGYYVEEFYHILQSKFELSTDYIL